MLDFELLSDGMDDLISELGPFVGNNLLGNFEALNNVFLGMLLSQNSI
jgi:hypothetical protein